MTSTRLFDPGPQTHGLTNRQQTAYEAIRQAGWDGLTTDEVGAVLHAHGNDAICEWCPAAGLSVGKALRRKQLVQQRHRKGPGGVTYTVWTVAGKLARPSVERSFELPEGF